MSNFVAKNQVTQLFSVVIGCAIYAIGFNLFIVPIGLYSGGFVGLAQLAELLAKHIFGEALSGMNLYGIAYFILNIPVLIIAWLQIGKHFLIKTLIGTVTLSFFTSVIPVPPELLVSDPAIGIVLGAAITGFGMGMLLTAGGSAGGIEALGVWFSRINPNFSVGKFSCAFNVVLYISYFLMFDVSVVIYSLLYMVLYSMTIDKSHYQNINMRLTIFTKKDGIDTAIMTQTGRGITEWEGIGAYTHEDSHIMVNVINKYELDEILNIIYGIDKDAFVIIDEGVHVHGNFQRRL